MSDDGAELSLDDYIKVKRKQGAFKVRRGGDGGVKLQIKRKGIRANKNAPRGGNRASTSPNKNRRVRAGRGANGYFANNVNAAVQIRGGVQQQRRRGRFGLKNLAGNRQNQNRAQTIKTNNLQRGQRRYRNRNNNQGYGFSQNLVRQARQRLRFNPSSPVIQRIQPRLRVGPRANNRRIVMKLVRKRVQRARMQLNRQGRYRGGGPELINRRTAGIRQRMLPLLSVTSGIRRTRTGFVTVSNPAEKQLQRLVVKEKIEKARQVKNNRNLNYSPNNNSFFPTNVSQGRQQPQGYRPQSRGYSLAQQSAGSRARQQSQGYRQQPQGYSLPQQTSSRQQIMPLMNVSYGYEPLTTYQQQPQQRHYQSIVRNNNNNSRASLNHNQRSIPAMGMSMYADQEENHRMQAQQMSVPLTQSFRSQHQQHQQHWISPAASSNPYSIRRTTVNNMYDPTHPAIDYEELPHGLNADIQRKINFIQNHGNRSETGNERGGGPREIIPDFRAPVSSSNMKLGDRFKMYMQ